MRYLIALLVVSSLLAGCQITISGPSEAEIEAENVLKLQVACLNGGREWDASTGTCVTPPTPTPEPTPTATPIPTQVVEWTKAWLELATRRAVHVWAKNDLDDRIRASGKSPEIYLDEFENLRNELISDEGVYGFRTMFPRFPKVRDLNRSSRSSSLGLRYDW